MHFSKSINYFEYNRKKSKIGSTYPAFPLLQTALIKGHEASFFFFFFFFLVSGTPGHNAGYPIYLRLFTATVREYWKVWIRCRREDPVLPSFHPSFLSWMKGLASDRTSTHDRRALQQLALKIYTLNRLSDSIEQLVLNWCR